MSRTRLVLLIAVPLVLIAVGVTVWLARSGDGESGVPPTEIRWVDCRPEVAESADGATCGMIERELDAARPELGAIDIGFERYEHSGAGEAVGTIVAHEGGPGYATTASRDYFLELFGPLLEEYDLLLPDARGTGLSGAIDCAELQAGETDYIPAVGACGRQLGSASDAYGSGPAADDVAALLDALELEQVDVYGVSYGTFMAQTFAYRHPDRVRTLVLDSAYPVTGLDPWYPDMSGAIRDALTLVCERDRLCTARGIDPVVEVRSAADRLHDSPVDATAPGADGTPVDVTLDGIALAGLLANATYGGPLYRELGAAIRAEEAGDPLPLARLVAEVQGGGGVDLPIDYSAGSYVAVICNDYPVLWDRSADVDARSTQYEAARAELEAADPEVFAPARFDDWLDLQWGEDMTCLEWPAPEHFVEPVAADAPPPDVPTLILTSDLFSVTSPLLNAETAGRIPGSSLVTVVNGNHAMSIADDGRCASTIVVDFIGSVGDTFEPECAATQYPEVRTLAAFPETWDDLMDTSTDFPVGDLAVATFGDVWGRYWSMTGEGGEGLRGGTFTITDDEVLTFELDGYLFVGDVPVDGTLTVDLSTGAASGSFEMQPPGWTTSAVGDLTWSIWEADALATGSYVHDGVDSGFSIPAP